MPITLLIILAERIGLITALAFLATRSHSFRRLMLGSSRRKDRFRLALIFGLFGILGTYTGVVIRPTGIEWTQIVGGPLLSEEAIANSRAVSVIVAGLVGGPWTGLVAGLIAGGHRYLVGGFTGLACAIATSSQGLISGLLRPYLTRDRGGPSPWGALMAGILLEILQMLIILLVAQPYERALGLVQLIAGPMILANSVGISVFLLISRSILA